MEALLVAMTGIYIRMLRWSLAHRWLVVLVMLASACAAAGGCSATAKSELSPMEDRGVIAIPIRAPDGATLEYTARYLDALDAIAAQYPEFDRRFMFIGGGQVSSAFGVLRTVDWTERKRHDAGTGAQTDAAVQALPGISAFPVTPPSLGRASVRSRSTTSSSAATATRTWRGRRRP